LRATFDNFGTEDAEQLSIVTPAIMGPAYPRERTAPGRGRPDTGPVHRSGDAS